jgi:hypothetical protein
MGEWVPWELVYGAGDELKYWCGCIDLLWFLRK